MIAIAFWISLSLFVIFWICFGFNWFSFFNRMTTEDSFDRSSFDSNFGKTVFFHLLFGFLSVASFIACVIFGIIWTVHQLSSVQ